MLRLTLISILVIYLVLIPIVSNTHAVNKDINQKCSPELLIEQAFLTSMRQEILNAITIHYNGEGKLFFLESIKND